MTSERIQQRSPAKIALHTLGGVLIGLLVALIPFALACESVTGLQPIHVLVSLAVVVFCGTLSAIGGEKMLDRIAEIATNLSF
jgi:VIT1/CCC1 family predicted Fe2+/Mn2+ transporter